MIGIHDSCAVIVDYGIIYTLCIGEVRKPRLPGGWRCVFIFGIHYNLQIRISFLVDYAKAATATGRLTAIPSLWRLIRSISCSICAVK